VVLVSFLRMMNISFPNCSLSININIVKKGDFIVIKNAGAYGFVMSSNYNQRNLPSEIVLDSF
jgi:hypothetical protein